MDGTPVKERLRVWLWDEARRFIDREGITCPESIWQHVDEGRMRDFVNVVCEIVGYKEVL